MVRREKSPIPPEEVQRRLNAFEEKGIAVGVFVFYRGMLFVVRDINLKSGTAGISYPDPEGRPNAQVKNYIGDVVTPDDLEFATPAALSAYAARTTAREAGARSRNRSVGWLAAIRSFRRKTAAEID